MLDAFYHWRIRAFENQYDYDASYLHELADLDAAALRKFVAAGSGIGRHRGALPVDALFAAKLAAAMHEDCGPCAQLVIDMAREAGVADATLRALAAGKPDDAPPGASLAYRFAGALLAAADGLDDLRADVERDFGPSGPATLGLATVSAAMYPVLKRAMGHAKQCAQLRVDTTALPATH